MPTITTTIVTGLPPDPDPDPDPPLHPPMPGKFINQTLNTLILLLLYPSFI